MHEQVLLCTHLTSYHPEVWPAGHKTCLGTPAARRVLEIGFLACHSLHARRTTPCILTEWSRSKSLPTCHRQSQVGPILQSGIQEASEGVKLTTLEGRSGARWNSPIHIRGGGLFSTFGSGDNGEHQSRCYKGFLQRYLQESICVQESRFKHRKKRP